MKLPSIVELAKETAVFIRYQDRQLFYSIPYEWTHSPEGSFCKKLEVPIPVEDAGEGEFLPLMKGIQLIRWIRKHLDFLRESGAEG